MSLLAVRTFRGIRASIPGAFRCKSGVASFKDLIVSDLPSVTVKYAKPTDTLFSCVEKMVNERVGALVIADKGNMEGLVTERDILRWASTQTEDPKVSIKEVMTEAARINTGTLETSLEEVCQRMLGGNFRHLPIVTSTGRVVRLVSIRDVAAQVMEYRGQGVGLSTITVKEVMESKKQQGHVEVQYDSNMLEAIRAMVTNNTGCVVVRERGYKAGVPDNISLFTERDYLNKGILGEARLARDVPVNSVMTDGNEIISVTPLHRIDTCLSLMVHMGFRHVLVMENNTSVGVISIRDALAASVRL